jgi:hypothetical protein
MWDAALQSSCLLRQDKHCIGSGVVIAEIEIVMCGGSCNRWRWMGMHDGVTKKILKRNPFTMETSMGMTKVDLNMINCITKKQGRLNTNKLFYNKF